MPCDCLAWTSRTKSRPGPPRPPSGRAATVRTAGCVQRVFVASAAAPARRLVKSLNRPARPFRQRRRSGTLGGLSSDWGIHVRRSHWAFWYAHAGPAPGRWASHNGRVGLPAGGDHHSRRAPARVAPDEREVAEALEVRRPEPDARPVLRCAKYLTRPRSGVGGHLAHRRARGASPGRRASPRRRGPREPAGRFSRSLRRARGPALRQDRRRRPRLPQAARRVR